MGGGREVHEGGDIDIPMANLCWCVAETNTVLLIILQLKINEKIYLYKT